jgi:hypothetical protein
VEIANMVSSYLQILHSKLAARGRRYLAEYKDVVKSGETHTEETDYDFQTGTSTPRSLRNLAAVMHELSRPERFEQYERAHTALSRGDIPKGNAFSGDGQWSIAAVLRGDEDIIEAAIDAAKRRGRTWIPSLLVVRLWRMTNEWIHDLALDSTDELALIPDLFLPLAAQRQRSEDLDAYYSSMAYDR